MKCPQRANLQTTQVVVWGWDGGLGDAEGRWVSVAEAPIKVVEVSSELCEILTAVELYTVNGRIMWCKNRISTKLLL